MGINKYILITGMIILGIVLMALIVVQTYRISSKRFDKEGAFIKKKTKFKCAVGVCEIIIKTDIESKFCIFHKKIQKYHLLFVKNNDKLQNKTSMYMNMNGYLFITEKDREKIYLIFENESKKYIKKEV